MNHSAITTHPQRPISQFIHYFFNYIKDTGIVGGLQGDLLRSMAFNEQEKETKNKNKKLREK